MTDSLVTLCHCPGMPEAQAIRASLEARGIPALIDGEHPSFTLRVMVARSRLRVAHALALEVIPDLPAIEFDDEDELGSGPEPLPLRRALPEDLVAYPDDLEVGALAFTNDDDDDDHDDDALAHSHGPRSLFAPRVGFATGALAAVITAVIGYPGYAVAIAVVLVGLVYVRVLPLFDRATSSTRA